MALGIFKPRVTFNIMGLWEFVQLAELSKSGPAGMTEVRLPARIPGPVAEAGRADP